MATAAFWKKEWDKKAKNVNPFVASAQTNFAKNPFEFLHNVNAVIEALELRPTDRLLDIGSNAGLYEVALAKLVRSIDGIDISKAALAAARLVTKPYKNISLRMGSMLRIPFPAQSFDKVLVNAVLHYLADEREAAGAFAEIALVLKPGGKAFVSLIPDTKYKEEYLAGIAKLKISKTEKAKKIKLNSEALWFDSSLLLKQARTAGLRARKVPIPPPIWQSWYMFSILLEKP